jgi:hypothetical protein
MKMPTVRETVEEMALIAGYNLAFLRTSIHDFAEHVENGTLHDPVAPYGPNGENTYRRSDSALRELDSTIMRMQVYVAALPKPTRSNRHGHR